MTKRLLITGATVFVENTVCEKAIQHGLSVKGVLPILGVQCHSEPFVVGEIIVATAWGFANNDV